MRFDIENQMSVAQAFTGALTVSTNSYQKQSAAQDISIGRRMAMLVLPTVAQGAGSTMTVNVIQADDAALTSNVEILSTVTAIAANMTLGDHLEVPIPQGTMDKEFLGVSISLTTGTTTITVDVYLVPQDEIDQYKSFPKINNASV